MSNLSRRAPMAVFAACTALLLATGCSGNDVKRSLGLKRNSPDEFQVVARPPLSVPPVYHLRPPSHDLPEVKGDAADVQARSLITGAGTASGDARPVSMFDAESAVETAVTPVTTGALASHGEEALLRSAGVNQAQEDIRQKLHQDNLPKMEEALEPKNAFFEKLKQLGGGGDDEPVVDAAGEAERIARNRDEKKPLNEGDVKEIDPSQQNILDRLF